MNNISKDLDIDKKLRGFKFAESSRHLSNQIDKEDVDSLKTVQATINQYHIDIIDTKLRTLGKKLNYWDRNAPYPRSKNYVVSWKQAKILF